MSKYQLFIKYEISSDNVILGLETEAVETLISEGGQVSDEQWVPLEYLEPLMKQAFLEQGNSSQIEWRTMRHLDYGARTEDGPIILSNFHASSGGDEHAIKQRDDPVLDALIELCVAVYPYTLIPFIGWGSRSIYIPSLFGTGIEQNFQQAVLKDASLRKLFNALKKFH